MIEKFKNKKEKRKWLSHLLARLAVDVEKGEFGKDGCESGIEGYTITDIVDDAMKGYDYST